MALNITFISGCEAKGEMKRVRYIGKTRVGAVGRKKAVDREKEIARQLIITYMYIAAHFFLSIFPCSL